MEFRELAHDRRLQRPTLDPDELTTEALNLRAEFDLRDIRCEGGDWSAVAGEGRLSHVWVTDGTLSESEFDPLELTDVRMSGIDLSNARWNTVTARRVEWLHCRAMGWQLSFAQITDVYLEGCRLDYSVIEVGNVKGLLVFSGCSFTDAIIRGDLSRAVFTDCEFNGAEFDPTNAKGCDLRGSSLAGARGLLNLYGAWLDQEQVTAVAPTLAAEAGLRVRV